MHETRRTNTQGKVQKYKCTKVVGEKGKGKTSQATKGTNTKSHTQTQECTSEARRRPKAPKQRSNAMRQVRDKQHSSSGGRRRNSATTATGRPAQNLFTTSIPSFSAPGVSEVHARAQGTQQANDRAARRTQVLILPLM